MQLIADSGSTKTHWLLISDEEILEEFYSVGINPYIQKTDFIANIIRDEVAPQVEGNAISHIHFYGAGCSSFENIKLVASAIKISFPTAEIFIKHDMLGAAIALFGDEPGIAAILGTGSNSCVYDGKNITENIPSLGYVLGDEGSGAHMGKMLIIDFLYDRMGSHLSLKLIAEFGLSKELILDNIYKKPNPNRWLASFAPFLLENIEEEYCKMLVEHSFDEFYVAHILPYQDYEKQKIGFVGSIARYFNPQLINVGKEHNINNFLIMEYPGVGLANYHINKNKV
ncbi:MAG: hypothetical protein NTX03_04225 [Bacteroidetes bacterium]|nr:hypothetical protein [Bacteroidota bacterium]